MINGSGFRFEFVNVVIVAFKLCFEREEESSVVVFCTLKASGKELVVAVVFISSFDNGVDGVLVDLVEFVD